MKLQDFNIDFNKFQNETHIYTLELDDSFFALKEHSLFEKCIANVSIQCTRLESTISMKYKIVGRVGAECERCLRPIELELNMTFNEVYKLTSDRDLIDSENYLSDSNPVLSIYDSIYENICTHLPNRLICENAIEKSDCNIPENNEIIGSGDPRWDKLKNLIK